MGWGFKHVTVIRNSAQTDYYGINKMELITLNESHLLEHATSIGIYESATIVHMGGYPRIWDL